MTLQELASCSERVESLQVHATDLQVQQAGLHAQLATLNRKNAEAKEETEIVTASIRHQHGQVTQQLARLSKGQALKV